MIIKKEIHGLVNIFTDGSSRGNPGPGGWGAIISWMLNDSSNSGKVEEIGGAESNTTNNRMELSAVIGALTHFDNIFYGSTKDNFDHRTIIINTDSNYVINGATKWLAGWQRNNWITSQKQSVLNRDLWQKLADLVTGKDIVWRYVGGHIGIPGNERCDEIATSLACDKAVDLYKGSLAKYSVDLSDIGVYSSITGRSNNKKSSKDRARAKAYSYISSVGGVVKVHATWSECEARVKGKSGALYKKTLGPQDERDIIAGWELRQ